MANHWPKPSSVSSIVALRKQTSRVRVRHFTICATLRFAARACRSKPPKARCLLRWTPAGESIQATAPLSSGSFDPVRSHEKVSRDLPGLADLVDHVDGKCTAARENFRRAGA